MGELFSRKQCEDFFREQVANTGGAKKWLRKHKISGLEHAHHLIDSGTYFHHPLVLEALGFKAVERWETVKEAGEKP